jgi:hypothetical protein
MEYVFNINTFNPLKYSGYYVICILPTECIFVLYTSGCQPMVREKSMVVRGEIWSLFAILIRLRVTDIGSPTIFALLRCIKFTFHDNIIYWNFYDHYFIDVRAFLKKIMLVVRGIQNCEFSGP